MADLSDLLQEIGFTKYEARAYIALWGAADCNGYEVAKVSGIPRANVYPVLERLASRHAIRRMETRKGTRYIANPPDRLFDRLGDGYQSSLDRARNAFRHLSADSPDVAVINLRDRGELFAETHELLAGVRDSLLVAVQPAEAAELAAEIAAVKNRGVRITTLCMEACKEECGGCVGDLHRYALAPTSGSRWLVLVADRQRLIAAEMGHGMAQAIATTQPLVVELGAAYIRQSLALATMAGTMGEQFDGLLSAQARKVLDDVYPDGSFMDWLHGVVEHENA